MSTQAARDQAQIAIELIEINGEPPDEDVALAIRALAVGIHRLCDHLERASADARAGRSASVPPPGWDPDPIKRFEQRHPGLAEVPDLDEAIEGRECDK